MQGGQSFSGAGLVDGGEGEICGGTLMELGGIGLEGSYVCTEVHSQEAENGIIGWPVSKDEVKKRGGRSKQRYE